MQHSILVEALYDTQQTLWVVRLQPFDYTGSAEYYAAVTVESLQADQTVANPSGYSNWLGSTFPPNGAGTTGPG